MKKYNIRHCPYCDAELNKGVIQAGQRIAWTPKVSNFVAEPTWKKDAVRLSKQGYVAMNYVDAYICERCKFVEIDYSD